MHHLSATQVKDIVEKNQLDTACLSLALGAARSVLPLGVDASSWRMVSSSAFALAPASNGPIEARAELISPPLVRPASCKVTLIQSPQDQTETPIFEITCSFTSDAQPAPTEDTGPQKKPLSDTAEARRRQIFDGACRVISKHGFGNATMREIAKESGLSVPLMYKYIKDKDDILYLITTMCMQDIIDFFDTEEFLSGSAETNLSRAVDKYIDYIGQNRRYINLVYSETRSLSAENRSRVFDMERAFMTRWQAILDRGIEQGVFRGMDTALMSNYLYFLCTIWALRFWSIGDFGEDTVRATLKTFILQGVQNGPSESS